MPHEFDSSPQISAVPPRMSDDEARAVIRLWQQEQMDSPQSALPTPADIAEGLGIRTEDAVRLLAQVRSEHEAARQAVLAAQQEELARAERDARLAELRARHAEAKAREIRAKMIAQAGKGQSFQADPPDEKQAKQDALYQVMLRDQDYWQRKDKGAWLLPVTVLVVLLLGMMIASIWHPLAKNSGTVENRSDKSCSQVLFYR